MIIFSSFLKSQLLNFDQQIFLEPLIGLSKFAAMKLKHEIESTGLIGQITFDFSASFIVSSKVVEDFQLNHL